MQERERELERERARKRAREPERERKRALKVKSKKGCNGKLSRSGAEIGVGRSCCYERFQQNRTETA